MSIKTLSGGQFGDPVEQLKHLQICRRQEKTWETFTNHEEHGQQHLVLSKYVSRLLQKK